MPRQFIARWVGLSALPLLMAAMPAMAGFDDHKPIWKQVEVLYCRGTVLYQCTESKCSSSESTAYWKVNFKTNTIQYLMINYSESILNKYFKYYDFGSVHSISLGERMMSFFIKDSTPSLIPAATGGPTAPMFNAISDTMKFQCSLRDERAAPAPDGKASPPLRSGPTESNPSGKEGT